jgi:hypothetical protein
MKSLSLVVAACLLTALGCGSASSPNAQFKTAGSRVSREPAPAADAEAQVLDAAKVDKVEQAATPRKIIYKGRVDLVVDDFDKADQQLRQLIEEQKGYISKSDLHGTPGEPRYGTWTVRVPAGNLEAFMTALAQLGELRSSSLDSEDVTEQYYDMKAHMKNNQVEEEGLQKLYLEKAGTGKLEDLLAVRREIGRIRTEIDQQQGKLKRWDKDTEYSTVTVTIHDRRGYIPPRSPEFTTSIGRAWHGSLEALTAFGKSLVLIVVALVPWLPVLAVVIAPFWLLARRWRRTRPETVVPVVPAVEAPDHSSGNPG